jgi:hypothetical protein
VGVRNIYSEVMWRAYKLTQNNPETALSALCWYKLTLLSTQEELMSEVRPYMIGTSCTYILFLYVNTLSTPFGQLNFSCSSNAS